MKKWIVFIEIFDKPDELGLELNKEVVRAIIGNIKPELPESVTYNIKAIEGPYDVPKKAGV